MPRARSPPHTLLRSLLHRLRARAAVLLSLTLLALWLAAACCDAVPVLVGSATLQACVGTAADPQEPPGCLRKLVAEVNYTPDSSSSLSGAAGASAVVSTVVDLTLVPGSTTPSTATLGIGGLHVNVSATALSVVYNLTYQREYNGWYSVSLAATSNDPHSCEELSTVFSCPGYTQVNGTVVTGSNGRCCTCVSCGSVACASDALMLMCSLTLGYSQPFCLSPSRNLYDGYGLSAGRMQYPVRVAFSGLGLASEGGDAVLAFDVNATTAGSTTRLAASVGAGGTARPTALEVAAAGLRDAVAVDEYVLFAPAGAASRAAEWVLLPPSLVTVDGSECDKVGVSAETYYRLATSRTCAESRTWCLHNQLLSFVSDAEGGLDTTGAHMASSLGAFAMSAARDVLVRTAQNGDGVVALRWTSSADDVAYTTDPSAAVIDAAVRLLDAASGASSLSVTVRNNGVRASWYGVRAVSCGGGGVAASGDVPRVVLDAGASATVSLTLSGQADAETTVACVVALFSSSGARVDDTTVSWRGNGPSTSGTTAPPFTTTSTSTSPTNTPSERLDAMCVTCAFTDLLCIIKHVCVGPLYAWLGIVEGVLLVVWCVLYWRSSLFPCWFREPEEVGSRLFSELLEDFRPQIRAWYTEQAALRGDPQPVWSDEDGDDDGALSDSATATTATTTGTDATTKDSNTCAGDSVKSPR